MKKCRQPTFEKELADGISFIHRQMKEVLPLNSKRSYFKRTPLLNIGNTAQNAVILSLMR